MSDREEAPLVVLDAFVEEGFVGAPHGAHGGGGGGAADSSIAEATAVPTATALEFDSAPPIATAMATAMATAARLPTSFRCQDSSRPRRSISGQRRSAPSSYLYDLTRQGADWPSVIGRCHTHPLEARYETRQHRTALHEACRADAPPAVVAALLEADGGEGACRVDAGGNVPLHLVFSNVGGIGGSIGGATAGGGGDRPEVVDLLLTARPDAAGIQNRAGSNPLMAACDDRTIDPAIVQSLLLAHSPSARASDRTGRTALARYGDARGTSLAVVRLLLDADPDAASTVDSEGRTPLHRPAFDGNLNLVESILLRDGTAASVQDGHGRTALHRACQCSSGDLDGDDEYDVRREVVRLLLDAYPEAASVPDRPLRRVPLHYACLNRRPSTGIVADLLDADPTCVSAVDSAGRSPLHDACSNATGGTDEIVSLLLDVDPTLARMTTRRADTALHLAAERNDSIETVTALADLNPDAIVSTNDYGFTPLHCACRSDEPNVDVVRVLLDRRPDGALVRTNGGELPLHLACLRPDVPVDVVTALLGATPPAPPGCRDDDARDRAGNTPLHDACFRRSSHDVVGVLASSRPEWVTSPNAMGYTPLHLACKAGTVDVRTVRTLLDVPGGDEAARVSDGTGHTPLHSSCRAGASSEVVTALLRAYPEATSLVTTYGDAPLHLACDRNVPFDVLVAVARGGDRSIVARPNHAGLTPLQIVMERRRDALPPARPSGYAPSLQEVMDDIKNLENRNELDCRAAFLVKYLCPGSPSLLHASLSVRRRFGSSLVRHDFVSFVVRDAVVRMRPEDVRAADDGGSLPLHIEAGVPGDDDERAAAEIADGAQGGDPREPTGTVLELLVEVHPEAAQTTNGRGEFPLDVAMQSGRGWNGGIKALLAAYPPALLWQENIGRSLLPYILARVGDGCGVGTVYQLVKSKPDIAKR